VSWHTEIVPPRNRKQRDEDEADERKARIDMLLEELRLNTEDLHELGHAALERARQARLAAGEGIAAARARAATRKKR
jgi:hypothetical protein